MFKKAPNGVGAIDKDRRLSGVIMSVEANVQKMIDDLNSALVDAAKHDKGNAAAGTRVRKAMQAAKAFTNELITSRILNSK